MNAPSNRSQAAFPTTCWTVMLKMRDSDNEVEREKSWGQVCETYWFPLYAFARKRKYRQHDAEDAVQGFFATVGTATYFEKAEKDRGKLRTFLLTGFTRYLKDLAVQRSALKRGGGEIPLSFDVEQAEEWLQGEDCQREEVLGFERHWAQTIMRSALESLQTEAAINQKGRERFQALKPFLSPDTSLDSSREVAAQKLGISPDACDKAIQRLRQSFRQTVKDLIAGTLENPTPESIYEEMQQLQRSLMSR